MQNDAILRFREISSHCPFPLSVYDTGTRTLYSVQDAELKQTAVPAWMEPLLADANVHKKLFAKDGQQIIYRFVRLDSQYIAIFQDTPDDARFTLFSRALFQTGCAISASRAEVSTDVTAHILNSIKIPVYLVDKSRTVILANRAFLEMFPESGAIVSRSCCDVIGDFTEGCGGCSVEPMLATKPGETRRVPVTGKDGRQFEFNYFPVTDANGELTSIGVYIFEVSSDAALKEEVDRLMAELRQLKDERAFVKREAKQLEIDGLEFFVENERLRHQTESMKSQLKETTQKLREMASVNSDLVKNMRSLRSSTDHNNLIVLKNSNRQLREEVNRLTFMSGDQTRKAAHLLGVFQKFLQNLSAMCTGKTLESDHIIKLIQGIPRREVGLADIPVADLKLIAEAMKAQSEVQQTTIDIERLRAAMELPPRAMGKDDSAELIKQALAKFAMIAKTGTITMEQILRLKEVFGLDTKKEQQEEKEEEPAAVQ